MKYDLTNETRDIVKSVEKMMTDFLKMSGTSILDMFDAEYKKERKIMKKTVKLYKKGVDCVVDYAKVMDELQEKIESIDLRTRKILEKLEKMEG